MPGQKIILNSASCRNCGDTLISRHAHDFKMCQCKMIGVDGGHEYLKRIGNSSSIVELSKFA